MGCSGVDVVLSPCAKDILNILVECKAVEKINLSVVFQKHLEKYRNQEGLKLLVHSRNRVEPVVMLTLNDFAGLLESYLVLKCQKPKTNEKNTDPSLTPL